MTEPLVSVVMPMRNAERFVETALNSILEQDYPRLEVVVVDDGSTDASPQKVSRYLGGNQVKMVPGPQRGISASFNCGLHAATGDIIMRCDADDRFVSGRIKSQVEFLKEHPEAGAVCNAYRAIDDAGRFVTDLAKDRPEEEITDELRAGKTRTHLCTFAVRAPLLLRIGGCREAFVTAEDLDLQLRLAGVGRVFFVPTPAYEYRIHGSSITHQQVNSHRQFYEELARSCSAERAEGKQDCVDRGAIPKLPAQAGKSRSANAHLQGFLTGRAWALRREGKLLKACYFGLRAIAAQPTSWAAWKSTLALLKAR